MQKKEKETDRNPLNTISIVYFFMSPLVSLQKKIFAD